LLGVLSMDLAFDLYAYPPSAAGVLPDDAAASLGTYYGRILGNNPMAPLVMLAMVGTIGGSFYQLARARSDRWLHAVAFVLCTSPIVVTAFRVVPAATRIAAQSEAPTILADLARTVLYAHVFCFASFVLFVAVQLCVASRSSTG
jgi:hypothetical protein